MPTGDWTEDLFPLASGQWILERRTCGMVSFVPIARAEVVRRFVERQLREAREVFESTGPFGAARGRSLNLEALANSRTLP